MIKLSENCRKTIWFYFNLLFIINFSLTLFSVVKRFKFYLPHYFNNLFLLFAYLVTLLESLKDKAQILTNPNFLASLLFICFPSNIYLFPYYLLSIYHVIAYILADKNIKNRFESFYQICVFLGQFRPYMGRLAMYSEVLNIFISILFSYKSGLKILFINFFIVRQQYLKNKAMTNVVNEIIFKIDLFMENMPKSLKIYYSLLKNTIGNLNKIKISEEKNK